MGITDPNLALVCPYRALVTSRVCRQAQLRTFSSATSQQGRLRWLVCEASAYENEWMGGTIDDG